MHNSSGHVLISGLRSLTQRDIRFFQARKLYLVHGRYLLLHPKHRGIRSVPSEWTAMRYLRTTGTTAAEDQSELTVKKLPFQATSSKTLDETTEELRQLNHIRTLVSQLHRALHIPDSYQAEMESMQKQLDEIRTELRPLEEQKVRLLIRAERRSKALAWAGLGFMGMQFGFLARLTWWEYSWDIIEPITYFVTYGTAMGLYAYYLVTRQDYSFPGVTERWTAVAFHRNVRRSKWEMNRYMELRDKLGKLQSEVEKMSKLAPDSLTNRLTNVSSLPTSNAKDRGSMT